ncbi:hypothetical protein MKX03_023396, partial [Papaver bracteatum]
MASENANVQRYIPNLSPSKSPLPLLDNQTSSTMQMESPLPTSNEGTSSSSGGGVLLTWDDLWVTVPSSRNGASKNNGRALLQGLDGYAQPSEILAIMGPSGSGKSTLLDALGGRGASNTRQSGSIKVNGRKQTLAFGNSAYVTQDNVLTTTLTVKECVYYSALLQLPNSMTRSEKKERAEATIRDMGLQDAMNTRIGEEELRTQDNPGRSKLMVYYSALLQLPNSMTRSEKKERAEATIRDMGLQDAMNTRIGVWSSQGLSGGQKRRASLCIEILKRPKLLFLDEPTSGLDSAASYHVVDRIMKLSQQYGMTVIASVHQPSSEVFDLFHNLCLLSSGRTVYFGPASAANETSTETLNKVMGGKPTTTEEAINILVKSYKSSQSFQQVKLRISEICKTEGRLLEKGNQASFLTQSFVLTRRSFVNMYRDVGYYWLRLGIYISLGLCIGTIYYQVGGSFGSIQSRDAMLMFIGSFLTFMAIGGFPSFVEDMKIFGRERLNGHYTVAAFVIGNTLSSIPYLLLISLVPGVIAYYLVGLHKGFEHFLFFILLLFVCMMLVESLMMIVASIVPDFLMGIITGAGIQELMRPPPSIRFSSLLSPLSSLMSLFFLNGGFLRLPNDLPKPFWRYPMYYIAFHRYANEGFYRNEFEGLSFPNNQVVGGSSSSTIRGEEILKTIWQLPMGYSKWVDMGVLLGMVVLYRLIFF